MRKRARPTRKAERPKIKPGDPLPPKEMSEAACDEWYRVVAAAPPGLLAEVDEATLSLYCQSYVDFRVLTADLNIEGETSVTARDGVKRNPKGLARDAVSRRLLSALRQLGFSPASRTQIALTRSEGSDELESLIEQAHGVATGASR